jgi:hypothetical protein
VFGKPSADGRIKEIHRKKLAAITKLVDNQTYRVKVADIIVLLDSGTHRVKLKVKLSRCRPGQALGVPGVSGSRISRQSAHEGGKFVSPTHRPFLPPGMIPGTHFC